MVDLQLAVLVRLRPRRWRERCNAGGQHAPVLRKVRRVTGEPGMEVFVGFMMGVRGSFTSAAKAQCAITATMAASSRLDQTPPASIRVLKRRAQFLKRLVTFLTGLGRQPVRVSGSSCAWSDDLCACPGGCARGRRLEGVFQRAVRASGHLCAHP
jgi:hypothetical protein